jgi:WD40 repeat protein
MARIVFASLILIGAFLVSCSTLFASAKPTRAVVLEHAEFRLTPAALVFSQKGELYVAYRDKGSERKSSVVRVRVFDPASGRELRSTQLQTTRVPLPNGANHFLLSRDNSLLLYSQFYGSTYIALLDAETLREVTRTTSLPKGVSKEFPSVAGLDPGNKWVLVRAEIDKDFPPGFLGTDPKTGAVIRGVGPGSTFRMHGTDIRLVRLDSRDLSHVASDVTFKNPIPESGFAVGDDGTVRIIRANMLYRYDPDTEKATLELSIHNQDDIRNVLFLSDHSLLLWSDQNEFGYIYRFSHRKSALETSQRINKSGVAKVLVSPDQLYGAALCERQKLTEGNFGAIASRTAVVFDAKTLKIVSEVPIERDLFPELAIWHGDGKIVLATQASSNKLLIYELAEPKSGSRTR